MLSPTDTTHDFLGMLEQNSACLSRASSARTTVEKRNSQLILEPFDLVGESGLCDVKPYGSPFKTTFLYHGLKTTKLV
jgi:hypothetical protein